MNVDFKQSLKSQEAAMRACCAPCQIKRTVGSKGPNALLQMFKAFFRPHSDYCVQAWRPYLETYRQMLKLVQCAFTWWLKHLGHMRYEKWLWAIRLYSLEKRGEKGDSMQAFKIIKGLAEVRDHCGALFQITWMIHYDERWKNCARTGNHRSQEQII